MSGADAVAAGHRRRRGRWLHVARWLFALVALGVIVSYLVDNLDTLRAQELRLRWPLALAAFATLVAYLYGRALVWHGITRTLHVAIPLRHAVAAWFLSLLGKYLPGKVFHWLARLELYRREGHRAGRITLAFGLETAAALLAQVLTVLLALLLVDLPPFDAARPWLAAAVVVVLIGMNPRLALPVVNTGLQLFKRGPVTVEVTYLQLLRVVLALTAVWLVFGLGFYLLVDAVYVAEPHQLPLLIGAVSTATAAGILAIAVPSGLGVREGVLAVLLAQVMPAPVAALVAVAARVWVTIGEAAVILGTMVAQRSLMPGAGQQAAPTPSPDDPTPADSDPASPRRLPPER